MRCGQSDVMHGPHLEIDGKQRKTYLIAFIDDHSRLIVYGRFYASENTGSFMHALEQAFLRRGLPRKLYVDNGSAFRSKQLMYAMASLAIALIHSRPYKPQGRGKIERFFKSVRRRVNKDRTIILDKRLYQGPVALIGKQVELLFHEGEYDRVELKYQNKSFGFINQVDLNVNCRVKRDKKNNPVISVEKATAESGQMWGGKL